MYTEVSSAEILIIVALWFLLKKNLAGTKKASRKCPFCNSVLRRRATAILFKSNILRTSGNSNSNSLKTVTPYLL